MEWCGAGCCAALLSQPPGVEDVRQWPGGFFGRYSEKTHAKDLVLDYRGGGGSVTLRGGAGLKNKLHNLLEHKGTREKVMNLAYIMQSPSYIEPANSHTHTHTRKTGEKLYV